ncbi:TVP38/TMEM64 family protein [Clostridia bacterium]|nr:TVP38/TMEM64 family protein [Clostridia bacterium]
MKSKKYKKKSLLKISALLITLIFYIGISILFYHIGKNLLTEKGRELVEQRLNSFGVFAPLLYIFAQVLNVVIPFIPGEPIEILGGVLFGYIFSTIYCFIGIFIGSLITYKIALRFGQPLIEKFVSTEKIQKLKILKSEKRVEITVFTLFFLPGIPKDLLTYIVPLFTKLPPKKYFPICVFARFPSIITSTVVGATLNKGQFLLAIIIFLVTALIGYVVIMVRNKN